VPRAPVLGAPQLRHAAAKPSPAWLQGAIPAALDIATLATLAAAPDGELRRALAAAGGPAVAGLLLALEWWPTSAATPARATAVDPAVDAADVLQ